MMFASFPPPEMRDAPRTALFLLVGSRIYESRGLLDDLDAIAMEWDEDPTLVLIYDVAISVHFGHNEIHEIVFPRHFARHLVMLVSPGDHPEVPSCVTNRISLLYTLPLFPGDRRAAKSRLGHGFPPPLYALRQVR